MHEKLPIYIDAYRLAQDIFCLTEKFPKNYKFSLGTPLNESALDLNCLVLKISYTADKTQVLEEFLLRLERIRIMLRFAADFNIVSCRKQAQLATALARIHTQAVAWLKSERRKERMQHKSMPESEHISNYSE